MRTCAKRVCVCAHVRAHMILERRWLFATPRAKFLICSYAKTGYSNWTATNLLSSSSPDARMSAREQKMPHISVCKGAKQQQQRSRESELEVQRQHCQLLHQARHSKESAAQRCSDTRKWANTGHLPHTVHQSTACNVWDTAAPECDQVAGSLMFFARH